jgi:hypothetical protein
MLVTISFVIADELFASWERDVTQIGFFVVIKSLLQLSIVLPTFLNNFFGYFDPRNERAALDRYCEGLGKQKDVLSIYALLQMESADTMKLETALVASLPSELAVKHLVHLSIKDKLDWYSGISGLGAHNSLITDLYLCSHVIHSGSEDIRFAGYIAAGEAKNGVLLSLAIIDYFHLRPTPVRYSLPYVKRQDLIAWYVLRSCTHLSGRDFLLNGLCLLLPPQAFCPTP